MPEPFPFAELLAALEDRGLNIGVQEHLRAAKLVERWDTVEKDSLRNAFAALLARTPEEVKRVHQVFADLYGGPPEGEAGPKTGEPTPRPTDRPKVRRHWRTGVRIALAVALLAAALLWQPKPRPVDTLPPAEQMKLPEGRPEPPQILDTVDRRDWGRALLGAAAAAALLFLGLYGMRVRRAAGGLAREEWLEMADALPGPLGYDLVLGNPPLPVPASVLDGMASLLGRHSTAPPRFGDLDVDRTLEQTLRAGLAPQVVLRAQTASSPLLVLEETGSSMLPWRGRVRALLDGLEARGVPLDRWLFDAGLERASPLRDGEELPLKELFRRRAESPLLIISPGEGSLAWTAALPAWRRRAWLHPVADRGYWSPDLPEDEIPILPLSPGGALAAARHLARRPPSRSDLEALARLDERPVAPLDVDRVRWLLELAPRRDPDLAELMRRRFFPRVPQAALLEALDAPRLESPPPGAPPAAEVHAFLAGVLASSRPAPGTTAFERWRLDLALHNVCVPGRGREAARELADLAAGHLAAEVEPAVERLAGGANSAGSAPAGLARWLLRWRVLHPLQVRAERQGLKLVRAGGWSGQRWRRPKLAELGLSLLGAAGLLLLFGFVLHKKEPVKPEPVYQLSQVTATQLKASAAASAPHRVDLYRGEKRVGSFDARSPIDLDPAAPASWYYVRSWLGNGRLAISEPVWVEPYPLTAQNNETAGEPMGTDLGPPVPMGTDMTEPALDSGFEPVSPVKPAPKKPVPNKAPPNPPVSKTPDTQQPVLANPVPQEPSAALQKDYVLLDQVKRLEILLREAASLNFPAPLKSRWSTLAIQAEKLRASIETAIQEQKEFTDRNAVLEMQKEVESLRDEIAAWPAPPTSPKDNEPTASDQQPPPAGAAVPEQRPQTPPGNIRYSEPVAIDCSGTALILGLKYKLARGEELVSAEVQAIEPDGSVKKLPEKPVSSGFFRTVTVQVTFHAVVTPKGVHAEPNNTSCQAKVRLAVTVKSKRSGSSPHPAKD